MKQQIEALIKEAEERIEERNNSLATAESFELYLIHSSHIIEADFFLSRLKEMVK